MPLLSRLWFAWLTRRNENAGTGDHPTISIDVDGEEPFIRIVIETPTAGAGISNFNSIDKGIGTDSLTASSFRLQARGEDAWKPERFFVWGVEAPPPFRDIGIFPLAIEMGIRETLSTDTDEGVPSIPLRLVANGDRDMAINRLLILLSTTSKATNNSLEIQIISNDRLVALCEIRDTAQNDLESGASNFYTMPVIFPFTKSSLTNESITLRIKGGMDNWLPSRFFLFGLDDAKGRPESIVPLVHLQEWPFGPMEPDTTNGIASVTLPLVRE